MLARSTTPTETSTFALLGAQAAALATGDDTGGAWEAVELSLAPDARSPLHTIAADKLFYVAEGTVTITLGGRDVAMPRGGFVHVPANTAHCYHNTSGAPARLLVIATGSGHVDFLRGMAALTSDGPPDPNHLTAHTARYGVRILASPS